jgi:Tol biopolymer transport system component
MQSANLRRFCFRVRALRAAIPLLVLTSLGAAPPLPLLPAAQIFAPGIISGPANDGAPSFLPDGHTLFFARSGAAGGTILESHLGADRWSEPEIAPFSGRWSDDHPTVAPDGSYVVFVSTRPVAGSTTHVAHIWRVDRTASGWSDAVELPPQINRGPRIFAPSIAADGTIYFLNLGPNRSFQLFASRFVKGHYQEATPLPFSTPATADVDPQIAPDQSFMVFASSGREGPEDKKEHLYFVSRHNGTWGEPRRLRYDGDDANGGGTDNEPRFSPDTATLYFDSDRTLAVTYPRTPEQARTDIARINAWDDGNTNVWTLPLSAALRA